MLSGSTWVYVQVSVKVTLLSIELFVTSFGGGGSSLVYPDRVESACFGL